MKKLIALLLCIIAVLSVLVLSGCTTREELNNFPYRPKYVLAGVGDILAD